MLTFPYQKVVRGMKEKYRCGACNWKFTRNYAPNLCPYCGKAAVSIDATQAAEELLREIE
jgi:rubrerythrin